MKTEHPAWVRERSFVIPKTLKAKLEGLSEDEQLNLCRVASKVVIETLKNRVLFKNIPSKFLKNTIGTNYKIYVNKLVDWKIIQPNDKYEKGKFSKSYRLTHRTAAVPMERITFEKGAVQPLDDDSTLTDDVSVFVHRNLKKLGVRTELLPQLDVVDSVAAEQWAEAIYWQQFDLHYSKNVKRMFHSVIVMPRVARKNLILKEAPETPLYEYDIRSCHPVLMLSLMKIPSEKAAFIELLEEDIYGIIARNCGITDDRDQIKVDFLKFANGKAKNYFHAYFSERFPNLIHFMDRNKKQMAWFCQSVEAKIMTQIIPRLLMNSGNPSTSKLNLTQSPLICGGNPEGVFYIPMHDGWLGIERDEHLIATAVRDDFYKRVGYWVTITRTSVTDGEKVPLLQGRPPVGVEPVTIHR